MRVFSDRMSGSLWMLRKTSLGCLSVMPAVTCNKYPDDPASCGIETHLSDTVGLYDYLGFVSSGPDKSC